LVVDLGVHTHQSSVAAALNAIAADRNHVVSTLHGKGVPGKDIQTTDLELNPSYDNHGTVNGYDASESLSVRIPLSNVGKVLSAAATSAGNSATINGMSLDISDKSAVLDQARQNAYAQAYEAAKTDAQLAHESLGHVVSIKESQQSQTPPVPFAVNDLAGAASAAKSVAISPGRQAVTVTLDVVWSLG
ncbi:MAG: SIMPL domain-containing protein, partial [Mycobacteriales bacterium]